MFFLATSFSGLDCVESVWKRKEKQSQLGQDLKVDITDHYFRTLLETWISLDKFLDVQEANTEQEEAHGGSIQERAETHALV